MMLAWRRDGSRDIWYATGTITSVIGDITSAPPVEMMLAWLPWRHDIYYYKMMATSHASYRVTPSF